MKIVIVSDSHSNAKNFKKIIAWLNKENIKIILHCGDIGSPESLKESLENFDGKFFGVFGNMDYDYKFLVEQYNKIPGVKIELKFLDITIFRKIGITHKPEDAKKMALSGNYDLVFYGHTHKPWEETVTGYSGKQCRLINPGEVAGQIYRPTFAVYDVEKDFLELKILDRLNN